MLHLSHAALFIRQVHNWCLKTGNVRERGPEEQISRRTGFFFYGSRAVSSRVSA